MYWTGFLPAFYRHLTCPTNPNLLRQLVRQLPVTRALIEPPAEYRASC